MTRVVVASESFKGRRHAAFGIRKDDGSITVNSRAGRSLCGVPVQRFSVEFLASSGPRCCRRCNLLGIQEQHALGRGVTTYA